MTIFALVDGLEDESVLRVSFGLGTPIALCLAAEDSPGTKMLNVALDHGAERAIRLWDATMEGTDYLGTAYALGTAVKNLQGADPPRSIFIAGDRPSSAVGPALAERLSVPHLGHIVGASFVDDRLIVRRRKADGIHVYVVEPPLVLCVTQDAAQGFTLGGQRRPEARVELLPLGDLGLSGAELAYRKRFIPQLAAVSDGDAFLPKAVR